MHKAGFVNIVGNPNVGKSTLMNLLVGERISIATFKSQTTRHRIMGDFLYKVRVFIRFLHHICHIQQYIRVHQCRLREVQHRFL